MTGSRRLRKWTWGLAIAVWIVSVVATVTFIGFFAPHGGTFSGEEIPVAMNITMAVAFLGFGILLTGAGSGNGPSDGDF